MLKSNSETSLAEVIPKLCIEKTTTTLFCISGLVRSRDGGRLSPNTQPYMSLPSPNIQSAKSELSSENQNKSKQQQPDLSEELSHTQGPDTTQLVRRGALVPPKIDDPMDPDDDDDDGEDEAVDEDGYEPDPIHSVAETSAAANISQLSGHQARQFPRRSSVVVIPPMQVCPGDLLVYSKALTQRGNFPGNYL